MKKIAILLLLVSTVVIACHKKAVPTVTERTQQPVVPTPDSAKTGTATTLPSTMVAPAVAAGKVIYETKCTRCHQAKPVDKWTAEQWVPILKSMIPKAKLDFTEGENVTAYVNMYAKKP